MTQLSDTCPTCKGKNFVYTETDYNVIRCPTCGGNYHAKYLLDVCGVPAPLRAYTWTTKRTGFLVDAHRAAERLIGDPRWFFTVRGPFGTGKTGLLVAIVNEAVKAGHLAIYITTADLLDSLREDFDHQQERFDLYRRAKVLALDEFDRFKPTEWAEQKFFQLIEHRYEHGAEMLTALATNSEFKFLPGYLVSRLEDRRCQVHTLPGRSLRKD